MSKDSLVREEVEFKVQLPIQIRFSDIDALGHINNNIYLSFFDLGKVDYLDKMRGSAVSWTEGSIVIAHLEIDFKSPVFYKEKVVVESKIVRIGNKSGEFIQQLRNVKSGDVKAVSKSVFVYIDSITQRPSPIPYAWRQAVEKHEGVKF